MQWRVLATTTNNSHTWGEEVVVYNAFSGATHLLDHSAGQILQKLQQFPSDSRTLAPLLAADWQVDVDDEMVRYVRDVLISMHALSLIERV
jgi:PqqD family protein of HPr-rel-A system